MTSVYSRAGLVQTKKKVSVYISSNFRSIKESTAHDEQFNLATGEHLLIWFVCLFVRFDFVCLFCFVFSFVIFVCVRGVWGVCVGWVGCVWGVCVGGVCVRVKNINPFTRPLCNNLVYSERTLFVLYMYRRTRLERYPGLTTMMCPTWQFSASN